MRPNREISKRNGECKGKEKMCYYYQAKMCNHFMIQLEQTLKSLYICNQIYGKTYTGGP